MESKNRVPIILIGGVPGVGKTSISGYIAKKLGIDIVLSVDYLREFLRPFASEKELGIINTSVYDAWREFGDKNQENILKGFIEQGNILNKGLNSVMKRAIKNGEPMIIETLYFIPEQINREIYDDIIKLYIYISDNNIHTQRLNEREKFTHMNSPGQRLSSQLDVYRVMMDYSISQSNKLGIKVFDNINYLKTRDDILSYLKESIKGV